MVLVLKTKVSLDTVGSNPTLSEKFLRFYVFEYCFFTVAWVYL